MTTTTRRVLAVLFIAFSALAVWAVMVLVVPTPPTAEEMGNQRCVKAGGVMTLFGIGELDRYSWYVNVDGEVVKVAPEMGERVCALPASVYRTGEYKHPRQILTNY